MNFYWTNRCKENGYRCPKCQNMIGNKDGQMPIDSKNHKIQLFDGQVKCVVCSTTIGYFPHSSVIKGNKIRLGMTTKVLNSVEYVTAVEQKEF